MRLSYSLAKTLKAITPYDTDSSFGEMLSKQHSPVEGVSPRRLVSDIAELRDAGMLSVFEYPAGTFDSFTLTSRGRDYFWNRRRKALKRIAHGLFQLLCGAAGGVVVWVLGRLCG